jgi:antitoxin (DNA-binding transcriptional repressor) of toxin-antitoxin stability system
MASKGEVILVTDRDQVVAEIVPPNPARAIDVADALLAQGFRNGWVRPALVQQEQPPVRKPVASFKQLMRELDLDRSDR